MHFVLQIKNQHQVLKDAVIKNRDLEKQQKVRK